MDPLPRARPAAVDEAISEEDHWRQAMSAKHALATPPALEPALEWVLKVASMWRHDLRRIRRGVVQELKVMVDDMEDTTKEWLARRPFPVRSTYSTPDRDRPTQVPLLLHLLRDAGYPDVTSLSDDLSDGFDMLGEIKPGPGWKARDDDRYFNSAIMQEVRAANRRYLLKRLPTARPGAHSDALLAELVGTSTGSGHWAGQGPNGLAGQDRGTAQFKDMASRGVLSHHPDRRERRREAPSR